MSKIPLIRTGELIENTSTGVKYRILSIFDGNTYSCECGTEKLKIIYLSVTNLRKLLAEGKFKVVEEKKAVFDENTLGSKERAILLRYKEACEAIVKEYQYKFPDLTSRKKKPLIDQLCQQYHLERRALLKRLTRYLQSGYDPSSLLPRYAGRPGSRVGKEENINGRKRADGGKAKSLTVKDHQIFQKYLKKYLKSEVKSITAAYHDMLAAEYSVASKAFDINGNECYVSVPLPEEQRPSFRQFYYFVSTHSDKKTRQESKKTAPIVRNDSRVFTGTVRSGVLGPGHYVECDAQEMDIALVSEEYPDQAVGRPILYVMIDVFSQLILAASLAMDNNSVVGLTNCFMNLVEPKLPILNRYNVSPVLEDGQTLEEIWPTGIKPRIMKYDNGSDFISKPIARMLSELNIDAEFVSPGSGSMKPLVENFFGSVKRNIDDLLENKGLIRQTHNSKHHSQACLTYDEAYAIVLSEILYHNQKILTGFPKSADMKAKGVIAAPYEIWKYGSVYMTAPETFNNPDQVLYSLLLPAKNVSLSRRGIHYRGMSYFNPEDEKLTERMFSLQDRRESFKCRIDPRDIGHLYYLRDDRLFSASLPTSDPLLSSYIGMSIKRFDELEELDKQTQALEKELSLKRRINERKNVKEIVDSAQKKHSTASKSKNISQNRAIEKERISQKNSVVQRFPDLEVDQPPLSQSFEETQSIPSQPKHPQHEQVDPSSLSFDEFEQMMKQDALRKSRKKK